MKEDRDELFLKEYRQYTRRVQRVERWRRMIKETMALIFVLLPIVIVVFRLIPPGWEAFFKLVGIIWLVIVAVALYDEYRKKR